MMPKTDQELIEHLLSNGIVSHHLKHGSNRFNDLRRWECKFFHRVRLINQSLTPKFDHPFFYNTQSYWNNG